MKNCLPGSASSATTTTSDISGYIARLPPSMPPFFKQTGEDRAKEKKTGEREVKRKKTEQGIQKGKRKIG